jgi:hypothetical protein
VRRKDEKQIELKSGNIFYNGNKTGKNTGVGFLVNKNGETTSFNSKACQKG